MRKSLRVVLAVMAVLLMAPVSAYASPVDSFADGYDDLVNPKTDVVVSDPTEDYESQYEPQEVELYRESTPVRALPENPTVTDYVNNTVDSFNSVNWAYTNGQTDNVSLLRSIRYMLGDGSAPLRQYVVLAVGLVFVWWGVRKTKSIIWTAFRTGRLNLGTSIKRAYYRRKAKEWYG